MLISIWGFVYLVGWVVLSFETRSYFAAQAGSKLTFLVIFSCQHGTGQSYRKESPVIILARL